MQTIDVHQSAAGGDLIKKCNTLEASNMETHSFARYMRLCPSARVLAVLVFILTGSIIALGQQTTGSIVGTVKDQQGALVTTTTVKKSNPPNSGEPTGREPALLGRRR